MKYQETYWYARGYYDGRNLGSYAIPKDCMEEVSSLFFKMGYDKGVADYCDLDIEDKEV